MALYQDVYPTPALLRSSDVVSPFTDDILTLEYFEADPAGMRSEVFEQHHVVLNLCDKPHRVQNRRAGDLHDFTFIKDDIVITPRGVRSSWYWYDRSKCIIVTLRPEGLARFASAQFGVELTEKQLLDGVKVRNSELIGLGVLALGELSSASCSVTSYRAITQAFLVELLRSYAIPQDDSRHIRVLSARQLNTVMDYMRENFGNEVFIDDLAKQAGVSLFHFARLFKSTTGQTPHQALLARRIEHSKRLLRDSTCTLVEVALACGFADQAHFSRTFKHLTGVTPSVFRTNVLQ